ncbi:MAG: hypothetical protein AAGJ38_03925 [Planctomycetota bacterium]
MSQYVSSLSDADLNNFAVNFVQQLESSPGGPADFGIPDALASEFTAAQTAYTTAYAASQALATRGPSSIAAKDDARKAFLVVARRAIKQAELYPQLTNEQRTDLRIPIPDTTRTPIEPPQDAPRLQVLTVDGHLVKLRVVDQDNKKRKPAHISGYMLFSYVGENPPADPADYKFVTTESKLDYDFWLPSELVVGQKVWLTAAWLNRKLETGPACPPVMTGPTFGGLSQAA